MQAGITRTTFSMKQSHHAPYYQQGTVFTPLYCAMANGRCRKHGGASTGPRTAEGLARAQKVDLNVVPPLIGLVVQYLTSSL
jgi:hypothetical protein